MRKAVWVGLVLLFVSGCGSPRPRSAPSLPPTTPPPPGSTTSTTTAPTTTAPTGPPFSVASLTVPLVDTSRPTVSHGRQVSPYRSLTTLVWYPQEPGRHPLVVFAHGFQVGPSPYFSLLHAWAAHGYVVAAPEFPLTDEAIAGANLDENDIDNQPADVRFVTDRLVSAGSPVASRIDPGEVVVAGHSDGSETALAASISPTPPGEPAYRALIAMSVEQLPGVSHTDNPPMLVTQGDRDTINPPSYGYQVYDQGTSPKYLLVLKGGEHLPPLEAGSAWLPGIEAVTEAFLDRYASHDGSAGAIGAGVAASKLFAFQSA